VPRKERKVELDRNYNFLNFIIYNFFIFHHIKNNHHYFLDDKNGNDIYEGDIIFNDEDKEIVRWGFCSWLCGNESFADLDMRFVKIIGNVFENQEKEQA
jgi:hypothetical protein